MSGVSGFRVASNSQCDAFISKSARISYVGVVRRFLGHQTTNILRDS